MRSEFFTVVTALHAWPETIYINQFAFRLVSSGKCVQSLSSVCIEMFDCRIAVLIICIAKLLFTHCSN